MASSPDHNHTLNGDSNTHASKKPKLSFITPSEIAAEFSHHDPTVARINNGSFGSCPDSVLQAQRRWQLKYLSQPDHFYFNHLQAGILHSRTLIKDLINADHVDNAATAADIVLQQVAWGFSESKLEQGDAVVMLHYAYGAVKKSIEAYVTRAGGHVIELEVVMFQLHFLGSLTAKWIQHKLDSLTFDQKPNSHSSETSLREDGDSTLGTWRDLLENPKQWMDYRDQKRNKLVKRNHPDFKRKDGGHALWLNKVPQWVLSELKGMEFDVPIRKPKQANEGRGDKSWKDLVENPDKWWDNRLQKRNAKAPDFKHKEIGESLWLNSSLLR